MVKRRRNPAVNNRSADRSGDFGIGVDATLTRGVQINRAPTGDLRLESAEDPLFLSFSAAKHPPRALYVHYAADIIISSNSRTAQGLRRVSVVRRRLLFPAPSLEYIDGARQTGNAFSERGMRRVAPVHVMVCGFCARSLAREGNAVESSKRAGAFAAPEPCETRFQ